MCKIRRFWKNKRICSGLTSFAAGVWVGSGFCFTRWGVLGRGCCCCHTDSELLRNSCSLVELVPVVGVMADGLRWGFLGAVVGGFVSH